MSRSARLLILRQSHVPKDTEARQSLLRAVTCNAGGMVAGDKAKWGEGREALLAATVSVVANKGLHGLTFRAVAEAAGVQNSLITHYFGSKDGLLLEAAAWVLERMSTWSRSEVLPEREFGHDFAEALRESLTDTSDLQMFAYEIIIESRRRPDLRDFTSAYYARMIGDFEVVFLRNGYAGHKDLARAIVGTIDGLSIQQLTSTLKPDDVQAAVERIGSLLADSRPRATAG